MNIAVLIKSTTFHKNYGGLETQNRVLCEGLVRRGHSVTVIAPKRELTTGEKFLNGVRYVFVPASYKYLFASSNPNSWENKSVEAFKELHKNRLFDLVISQSTAGIGVIKNKKGLEVKVISIAHGTTGGELRTHLQNIRSVKDLYWAVRNLQYSLRQFFGRQRQYILWANKVVAVSNAVKKQIVDETFASEDLIEVIHNGVDPDKFVKSGVDEGEVPEGSPQRLIFTSRVIKSKGIFDLVKVMGLLRDQNIVVDVIGDGEDMEEAKHLTSAMDLKPKINFIGKLPYEEVVARLLNAHIFVLPTLRFEGFPMTVVEAMFASLPCVVYDMGGTSDAITTGVTGYLLKPGDINGFADKIRYLAQNPDIRKRMSAAAGEKAKKEFTIEKMLDKYEKVFEEVSK